MEPLRIESPPLEEGLARRARELLEELGRDAGAFRFRVAPNPCVGAAVLAAGGEVARGFHALWGEAHAEVRALGAAERSGVPRERWDTLVVTLEPCSTSGKTPPCTDAILASGIRRVIVGELDPDPRHRGRGLELLREAGVEVHLLRGVAPLSRVAPHYLGWTDLERVRRPRPWTIAKWAQTRTGQLSPPQGAGRWISAPASRDEVQLVRSRVDAIVTGIGTVLADDPRLSVRRPGDPERAPWRVVLDSTLRLSASARLFAPAGPDEGAGPVHVLARPGAHAVQHRALVAAGARIHGVRSGDDGRLSLREVARWLVENGRLRVLLEAGPTLGASWFRAGLVDQVMVYSGSVAGGRGASLAEYLRPERLTQTEHREVADDSVLEAFVRT